MNEKRANLSNLVFAKGKGAEQKNLQALLDVLWQLSDENNVVTKRYFVSRVLLKFRRCFEKLSQRECVTLVYGSGRGKPLEKIQLILKVVPQPKKQPKPVPKIPAKVVGLPPRKLSVKRLVAPLPHALLFVDGPNTCPYEKHADTTGLKARYLDLTRSDWRALREIVHNITKIPISRQDAYVYIRAPKEWMEMTDVTSRFERAGYQVISRHIKDIDGHLIADMVLKTMLVLQKNRTVKIVLVTGDGDYAYAVKKLKEHARSVGANLSVYVLSWNKNASRELVNAADNFFSLDKHLDELDPTGATMLKYHKSRTAVA